jgi:hypothetical protein
MKKAAQLQPPPPPSADGSSGSTGGGGGGGGKGHDMRGWVSYLDPVDPEQAGAKTTAEVEAEAAPADVLFGFAAVSRFTQLQHLDLSRTGLTSWRQVLRFAWMPSLEQLVLTDNQVTYVKKRLN